MHVLRQFEIHYNAHRPHQGLDQAAPLRAVPTPITDPDRITRLDILREDRLGGTNEGPRQSEPEAHHTNPAVAES